MNLANVRELLQNFDFKRLFIEELGWFNPRSKGTSSIDAKGIGFTLREIAQLAGVTVFEVTANDGRIPDESTRHALQREVTRLHHENLLIFLDEVRTQSLWYWVKREGGKSFPRRHEYMKGQPGDLFISKLSAMVVELKDFDAAGKLDVIEVVNRLRHALDMERVTKKFYREFQEMHLEFVGLIEGISDERDRRWYASVLLNRLMFIWFMQKKGFIDKGDRDYLPNALERSRSQGKDRFYKEFLKTLFFEGFAKPEEARTPADNALLGRIIYLNGGLFLEHGLEVKHTNIAVPDVAFVNLFDLFQRYTWSLNDTPGGKDDEINPNVLGYIFEKYINQKQFGAYYTRPEITEYLCEHTIYKLVLDRVNTPGVPGVLKAWNFASIQDLLFNLDAELCHYLLDQVLPNLSLLDPACGSGAFLVAAMNTMVNLYSAVVGRIEFLNDHKLRKWLENAQAGHKSIQYFIKKKIITENLFGVDIMEESTEIAKLRLFLALVASARSEAELEPLPNIDFNILPGNSLIGLMDVDENKYNKEHEGDLFNESYRALVSEKNSLVSTYRSSEKLYGKRLLELREKIDKSRKKAFATLDDMLMVEFNDLGAKVEEAAWDEKKNIPGKAVKRVVKIADIEDLHPFHWGYEFDEIVNTRGGFDAIITNPPWEIFKPNDKEFFEEYSELVTKNTMTIKEFETERSKLLNDPDIRAAWLDYLSRFPHVSTYFRSSPQYANQIATVNGKKAGSDINLYKLFTEQCFNLLRRGGQCGIVVPSGIYTDLGAKQLRELLFSQTEITGLFGFENRREIFEGVHRSFKFIVLTFRKGGATREFPTTFMRHDVKELNDFPGAGSLRIGVDLIRRLSPDSLSIMEFNNETDIRIAEKMLRFPLLGEHLEGVWNLRLMSEFHMTNDSHLFNTEPGKGRLPLYEGKMIHQFDHRFAKPRYWVDEKEGRANLLRHPADNQQQLDYQIYRLGFRDIARNTDARTMISTIIPAAFHGNKLPTVKVFDSNGKRIINNTAQLFICAVWNSFVLDAMLRLKVTSTLNFFYIYQLPIPRLVDSDPLFAPIVERAAKLICTTPEFDDLAREVGLGSHANGATDPAERARLRAELDGIIAHLYGLSDEEFAYILATFPLVQSEVKEAALEAFRHPPVKLPLPRTGSSEQEEGAEAQEKMMKLIARGEGPSLEFKETLEADAKTGEKHLGVLGSALKTICAFLNVEGGTLLIGVSDKGEVMGLEKDYRLLGRKKDADGFELKLRSLLKDKFHPEPFGLVDITFHALGDNTICRVDVRRSLEVSHYDESVYIRDGNQTVKLEGSALTRWLKTRMSFPSLLSPSDISGNDAEALDSDPLLDDDASPALVDTEPENPVYEDVAEEEEPSDDEAVPLAKSASNGLVQAHHERPRPIDEYADDELMGYIRGLFSTEPFLEPENAMRMLNEGFGYQRMGKNIRAVLTSALDLAVRRKVIVKDEGGYTIACRHIDEYEPEYLTKALFSVMGRGWVEQEEAIKSTARYLGFRRTGRAIQETLKSIIQSAVRKGIMKRDGDLIRRAK